MKRRAGAHFERVGLEVALRVAEQESNNAVAASAWQQGRNEIPNLGGAMVSQFDVFVSEPGGHVMWQGAVATMKDAEAMIKKLAQASPDREYVIFNLKTGQKIVVKDGRLGDASSKESADSYNL